MNTYMRYEISYGNQQSSSKTEISILYNNHPLKPGILGDSLFLSPFTTPTPVLSFRRRPTPPRFPPPRPPGPGRHPLARPHRIPCGERLGIVGNTVVTGPGTLNLLKY